MTEKDINLPGGERAVLLIHGLTGGPFEMKYLADKLNKAGYTVKVPCMAGHCTTLDDLKKTTWRDWYYSIKCGFDTLKGKYQNVSVAGLCMGAVMAMYLSLERGSDISAISLMSTTLFYDGWSMPWYKFLIPLAYYTPARYIYAYSEREPYGIKNKRLRNFVTKGLKENSIAYDRVPGVCMNELYKLINSVKKTMDQVEVPTLIIHSREDDTASAKNADYVERHIGAKDVRKILLDDCYHMITIDNEKELVANETIKFFNECSQPKRYA